MLTSFVDSTLGMNTTAAFLASGFLIVIVVHMIIRRSQDRLKAYFRHVLLFMPAVFLAGAAPVLNPWIPAIGLGILASASQYVFSFHGKN
jgi:hypothetical protein